jgi:hypothetical protein
MKRSLKQPSIRFFGALGFSFAGMLARAQTGSETLSYFGTIGQGNAAIVAANGQDVADNACVPTATANGLTYLENYYNFALDEPSPFSTSPNTTTQVNNLITAMQTTRDGTQTDNEFNGLVSYLSPTGANPSPSVKVTGQYSPLTPGGWLAGTGFPAGVANVNPTVSYLANALNANDGVELGIQWGSTSGGTFTPSRGGHEVTLQSISFNPTSDTGSITFIDPWGTTQTDGGGNRHAGGTAEVVGDTFSASLSVDQNGLLVITYPLPYDGLNAPQDNGTAIGDQTGQVARILDDTVEYVVPEPSTYIAGILILIPFGRQVMRRFRLLRSA